MSYDNRDIRREYMRQVRRGLVPPNKFKRGISRRAAAKWLNELSRLAERGETWAVDVLRGQYAERMFSACDIDQAAWLSRAGLI